MCEKCNYNTDKKGNYNKHIVTKKHLKTNLLASPKNGSISPKNGSIISKKCICEYCYKNLSKKSHMIRHLKKCDKKKITEIEKQKNEEIKKLNEEVKKLKKKEIELMEIEDDYEKLNKEYSEFIKKVATESLTNNSSSSITINGDNNKIINMYYIMNNFKNAPNFDEQITQQLSDIEKQKIIKQGPVNGCIELIKQKCIENKGLDERSIHCLDAARMKFFVRKNDDWEVDINGKKILKKTKDIVKEIFDNDFDIEKINDPSLKAIYVEKMIDLEKKPTQNKIIKNLCEHIC